MKLVILAGGQRSTINDDFEGIPKPMLEIAERPILWHIMKYYSGFGIKDFVICGGYKVNMIKDFFRDYYIYSSDITVDLKSNTVHIHNKVTEDWKVTVIDTGLENSPAQRIMLAKEYLEGEDFLVTYGDCLSTIDVNDLIDTHKKGKGLVTMTLTKPTGRNLLMVDKEDAWTNGCTFVYDKSIWECDEIASNSGNGYIPFSLDKDSQRTYKHTGFWRPVETIRDKVELERLWDMGQAPWKIWV